MALASDPGVGDPFLLRLAGRDRESRADEVSRIAAAVATAAEAASGAAWTGEAHEAFQAAIAAIEPDLALMETSLRATGAALLTYAGAVARIQDREDTLRRRRVRLDDEHAELSAKWNSAYAAAQGQYVTDHEQMERADALEAEIHGVRAEQEQLEEEWRMLVRDRERADQDCVAALSSRDVRGALSRLVAGENARVPADEMLDLLSTMSAADMKALAAAHPDLLDRLRQAPPEAVAAWWAGLAASGGAQQRVLVENLPAFIGMLGGVPAAFRVAANRLLAAERLAMLRSERRQVRERGFGAESDQPYASPAAAAEYRRRLAALGPEIAYLERAVRGDVQLYLYDPDAGHLIEMFGDPATADVILSFVPGTNTSMESFYTSTSTDGITALTRWQVENPPDGVGVAGFVVKQGDFPHLGDPFAAGPQHNWFASVLGTKYATFTRELNVVTGGTPLVSVEHSFGSAVGGVAETAGARFDARYMLAGIGMTEEWNAQPGTAYYASQGPGDVNRFLDDVQVGGIGYAVTPEEVPGVRVEESGLTGGEWAPYVLPLTPAIALPVMVGTALEQHNNIISGDEAVNGQVLTNVRIALGNAMLADAR